MVDTTTLGLMSIDEMLNDIWSISNLKVAPSVPVILYRHGQTFQIFCCEKWEPKCVESRKEIHIKVHSSVSDKYIMYNVQVQGRNHQPILPEGQPQQFLLQLLAISRCFFK